MMTESVLEQWGIDAEQIGADARREVGEADLFLGGSLADDLGTPTSDIDLYCFATEPGRGSRRVQLVGHRTVVLELHVVDVGHELATADSLVPLVTSADPPPPATWPLLTHSTFRACHALMYDRPIARVNHGPADRLRSELGADLLPVYVALRATVAATSLGLEAGRLAGGSALGALHCARLAVESALDAALAAAGGVSTNPKWRLTLARRRGLLAGDDGKLILTGLFPDHRTPGAAVSSCRDATVHLLALVQQDAFLARYPTVGTAVERIGRAVDMSLVGE